MKELYPAVANSPETVIMGMLAPDTTSVTVQDISKIPDAPNLLVLGAERPDSETVLLTAINGETLHIERGIDGTTARSWADRTTIARNYTAYDHNAMCEHVDSLETLSKIPAGEKPVSFVPAGSRSNISTGEAIKVSFGKFAKWFADLKAIAWTGSYADLGNKPTTFPPSAHTHDDLYYTQSEVDSTMSTKANSNVAGDALNTLKFNGAVESTFLRARGNYEGHINNCQTSGGYLAMGGKSSGMPFDNWGTLVDIEGGTGASVQIASSSNKVDHYIRHFNGAEWGEWEYIGTKTDQLVMQNGWTAIYQMSVTRSGNICTIGGTIRDGVITQNSLIFQLPNERYFPKYNKWLPIASWSGSPTRVLIDTAGKCYVENVQSGYAYLHFNAIYNCEGV